jgi:hypothetical protein
VFVVCEWVGRHRGHRVRACQYLPAATIGWSGRCMLAQRFEIRGESVIARVTVKRVGGAVVIVAHDAQRPIVIRPAISVDSKPLRSD